VVLAAGRECAPSLYERLVQLPAFWAGQHERWALHHAYALAPAVDQQLRPGMFASSELGIGSRELPVIPERALFGNESARRVFVVSGDRVEERGVLAGDPKSGAVPILTGVKVQERVVLSPPAGLRDGSRVK
jgi:hypothetical protein